jgi:hypothetical protein
MTPRIRAAALVLAALSAALPLTASAQENFSPRAAAHAYRHGRYGNDEAYYSYGRYQPYNGSSFYPQGPTVGDR